MRRWTATGVVAVTLAVCVAGAWAVALVVVVTSHRPADDAITALLDTVGGALVAAVVAWLASEWAHRHPRGDVDTTLVSGDASPHDTRAQASAVTRSGHVPVDVVGVEDRGTVEPHP